MKSSILSLLSLTALASTATASKDSKVPLWQQENPIRKTPIVMDTNYGSYKIGEFISLMETRPRRHRSLQDGNDPTTCNVDGEFFSCTAPNEFSSGDNVTKVVNAIRCELDDAIGVDYQANPTACSCSAALTEGSRIRECACGVCPYGRKQAVSLDCSVVADDPFITGTCSSLDCDGRCNGTGAAVVNQPTPAPGGPPTADGDDSGVSNVSIMVGLVVGTAVSFVSVYWV